MHASRPIRRRRRSIPWGQLAVACIGFAVIVTMVLVAEAARRNEARHRDVETLVERIWARSEEIGTLAWQGIASDWSRGTLHVVSGAAYVDQGFAIYTGIAEDLQSLSRLDHSAETSRLLADGRNAFGIAEQLVVTPGYRWDTALAQAETRLGPALSRLSDDSLSEAQEQSTIATQASAQAGRAFIESLLIGLALLLALGLQLHRMRRRTLLGEARRAGEEHTEQRIRTLIENSSEVITVVDPELRIQWQSPTVARVLGTGAGETSGRRLSECVHPDDVRTLEHQLATAIRRPGPVRFTARFRHAQGHWCHLETIAESRLTDPALQGVVLSMRDISERKVLEDELRHQAFHDALTGLANRALFEDRLAHGLASARRHGRPVAVLFLDLDDFKTINDSLGHASGDDMLRAVAIRIGTVVRVTDTAARLGGDEFAVLLEVMDGVDEAEVIAGRLLDALTPPLQIDGRELRMSASIGIAHGDGSLGVEELLRNADTAMYAAKDAGKGRIETFQDGMHKRVLDRLELTGDMQRALERGEFELDYQPIVELRSCRIVGTEALVRWAHPTRGRLAPGSFISLAEDTGLIVPLGTWVLQSACQQAAAWQREFADRDLYVTVNVSHRQLHHPLFPQTVGQALAASGLGPASLVLEITESLLPDDSDEIIERLHALKAMGVRVAVDDFGTGYSALSRLQVYPVDILKIDRSFIDGIDQDPSKGQLVRGILDLGSSLRMSVVAEGIEELGQAEELRGMDSALGQGFLFSRPSPPAEIHALLASNAPLCELSEQHGSGPKFGGASPDAPTPIG